MAHYDRDLEVALAASLETATEEEQLRQVLAASKQSSALEEQLRRDEALAHRVAVDDEEDAGLAAALAASMIDIPSTSAQAAVPAVEEDVDLDFAIALSLEEVDAPSISARAEMDPALAAFAAAVRREQRQRRPAQNPRRATTPEDRRHEQILADWRN